MNPANGTNGFWIGGDTLQKHINDSSDSRIANKFKNFNSAASGGAKATGSNSVALGNSGTSAINSYSTAIGPSAYSSGYCSLAFGEKVSALATYSVGFG